MDANCYVLACLREGQNWIAIPDDDSGRSVLSLDEAEQLCDRVKRQQVDRFFTDVIVVSTRWVQIDAEGLLQSIIDRLDRMASTADLSDAQKRFVGNAFCQGYDAGHSAGLSGLRAEEVTGG